MAREYSFVDIAVLDAVRQGFARGDTLMILDEQLDRVLWANGSGAGLLGFDDVAAAIGSDSGLPMAILRQIKSLADFPSVRDGSSVSIRFNRGVVSKLITINVTGVRLPDGESGVLLSLPEASRLSVREAAERALDGLVIEGEAAAMLDGDGEVIASTSGFGAMSFDRQTLAGLVRDVRSERDRLVKRRIAAKGRRYPSAIARLSDDPGFHLLIVIDDPQDFVTLDRADTLTAVEPEPQVLEPPAADYKPVAAPIVREDAPPPARVAPRDVEPAATPPAPPAPVNPNFPDRHARPARFVWRTDADGRFSAMSEEFAQAVGPAAADVIGRRFRDVATVFGMDMDRDISGLLERRDTWSGRTLLWPVTGTAYRAPVDLAALPVYDRDRRFEGFRGFGVVRLADAKEDAEKTGLSLVPGARIEEVAAATEITPEHDVVLDYAVPEEDPFRGEVPALQIHNGGANEGAANNTDPKVVRLAERRQAATEKNLSPVERQAFREIGDRLRQEQSKETVRREDRPDAVTPEAVAPEAAAPEAAAPEPEPHEPETVETVAELVAEETPFGFGSDEDYLADQAPGAGINDQPVLPVADDMAVSAGAGEPVEIQQSPTEEYIEEDVAGEDEVATEEEITQLIALDGAEDYDTSHLDAGVVDDNIEEHNIETPPIEFEQDIESAPAYEPQQAFEPVIVPLTRPTDTSILDKLPVPILIHSGDMLHYANPEFLRLTGYDSLSHLIQAGGLDELFVESYDEPVDSETSHQMRIRNRLGDEFPAEAFLRFAPWAGRRALMLVIRQTGEIISPNTPSVEDLRQRLAEMRTILDTATDGVILIDRNGMIRSISQPAEALFGFESDDVKGKPLISLFALESQQVVADYLANLGEKGVASLMNDGREVIGREIEGRAIPMFMTVGRLPGDGGYCAVVRDITPWKRAESELTKARTEAEQASSQKSEFLAKVSHEIRTPLNAIIGFSELMIDEKFGPISNDRYRDYLRDINRSGNHVLDLVNDLLDLSKIEAGQQPMHDEAVSLNDALAEAVSMMQPQANRERVIIRSSFAPRLPDVVADLRSIRQIALNILSNAVRYTQAGGQVVISTAYERDGSIAMRVRDTGVGMSQGELEQAMKPFQQVNALKRARGDGTGLGLPLTKAMVEANRARFSISSKPGDGTLVEIIFPSTRVLAQ